MRASGPRRSFSARNVIFGALVVAVSFSGTLWALNTFFPGKPAQPRRPDIRAIPPLPAASRTSVVIAPVAVPLAAIGSALDAAAPHSLSGKRDNPIGEALARIDIGWSLSRSPIIASGRGDGLTLSTSLTGVLRATGQAAKEAGTIAGSLAGLIGPNLGRGAQTLTTGLLDQRAEVRSTVTVTAKPTFRSDWRIEPNLSGQISVADGGLSIAGIKINVANEVKPFIDRAVNQQIAALQARVRNDPSIEQIARREWAKLCRSISFAAAAPSAPQLWLEMRPTRAFASHPRIDEKDVTITVGVQAETRVVPTATQPVCPFPAALHIVPNMEQGRMAIAVPIDVPFSEVNRLLETQLKGRKFPDDPNTIGEVTVLRASVLPSGDRLLMSLQVRAREKKSWFGLGADANIYVWGRPELDAERQVVKLTDLSLDVESEAAFGLLGAAARAAIPYLKDSLEQNATIDLKPFAASARKSIEAAIVDFQKQDESVRADVRVTGVRLTEIAFDSRVLRVIAEAEGNVRVAVSKLPGQ
ncbi:MAG TPA: DUF4403 family protein [Xanthobacteraceae bacterium]|nr:DUF4403 family protein [Xanthobacteraceae bacterium]